MTKRPNIIYLHSHDTGRYIQPYGYGIPTPNLQKLSEEGVIFRQAFNVGPTCSPSRAGLVTGMCAHSAGMIGLAHRGFSLKDYDQHIVHTLKAAGYATTLIGVQHVAGKAETIGYDTVVDVDSHRAVHVKPAAVEWLDSAPEGPFFLTVGFAETHRKYDLPTEAEDPRYTQPPATVPDTEETRFDMACFKSSARILDDAMGAVIDAVDRNGLAENTLIICTTDHGIAFPAMKCALTDHGIGVMLMMRGPGGFEGGKVVDEMVSHVDIFPTICDLLGIDAPEWLQGESMLPLVSGEVDELHEEIYSEVSYHASYEPKRCVRTKRWKYIRRFDNRETPVLPNCDDGPSKSVWLEHDWANRPVDQESLYDLVYDPSETHNLVGDPTMGSVLADMRQRLTAWMERTDDPLLYGDVQAPSGAVVNDPDGLSPNEPTITVE